MAVKRQAQIDALKGFSHDGGTLKNATTLYHANAPVEATHVVHGLTRQETTCEDLVKSYIQKSVILRKQCQKPI